MLGNIKFLYTLAEITLHMTTPQNVLTKMLTPFTIYINVYIYIVNMCVYYDFISQI